MPAAAGGCRRRRGHGRSIATATLAGAVALLAATSALAQPKTLTVAAYGGSWEQTMRKEVIPAFEKKHGVKVEYVAGNSTDTLAKLQAQKGNQQIDVAIVDDGPMYQAIQLGFCGKIDGPATRTSSTTPRCSRTTRRSPSAMTGTGLMYQHQGLQGEGLGDADLLERPEGSRSSRSSSSSRRSTTPTASTR